MAANSVQLEKHPILDGQEGVQSMLVQAVTKRTYRNSFTRTRVQFKNSVSSFALSIWSAQQHPTHAQSHLCPGSTLVGVE